MYTRKVMTSFGKNDSLSVEKRKIGNNFHKNKDYERALNYYQQAVVLASTKENKSLSYGNISAVYAAVKDAKSSISNMAAARKFHTPKSGQDNFLERLSRREKECNNMELRPFVNTYKQSLSTGLKIGIELGNEDNLLVKAFPIGLPLTYPSNPKVPGLVDRVGKAAKTLYATEDMNFGDVIAVTKSIASAYEKMFEIVSGSAQLLSKHFCSNCGITQFSVIQTCDHCISRFCSDSCKETSIRDYHSLECQLLLSGYLRHHLEPDYWLALRMAFKYHSAGLEAPSEPTSCFDWTDGGESMKDELAAINGFRDINENTKDFLSFLTLLPEYKKIKDKDSFWKLHKTISLKIANNMVDSSNRAVVYRVTFANVGVVANIDWLHGLFEHSCKPNVIVFRPPHLNEHYYVLLDNVKAGEKLNIAYE